MIDFVKLNGTAVRVTDCRRRTVERLDGPPLAEVDLVIILRGRAAHEALVTLLERRPIVLEIPPEGPALETTAAAMDWTVSGEGEGAAYRHELTLREVSAADEEPPLPAEPAGGETALVGLRLEALIEALDRAGVVNRSAVDDAFRRLLETR